MRFLRIARYLCGTAFAVRTLETGERYDRHSGIGKSQTATHEEIEHVARGARSENLISILRNHDGNSILAVIPRWLARTYTAKETLPAADFWAGTALLLPESTPGPWTNVLTGESVESHIEGESRSLAISDVLKRFPIALLAPAFSWNR